MTKIAIVGATGIVGSTFLKVLEEKKINECKYTLFASKKSKGKCIKFMNKKYIVEEITYDSFKKEKFDYALFSAGAKTSKEFAPIAASTGCIVIDNSSYFRMDKNVPLVVPQVNKEMIFKNNGIIANPNCSTIQAVIPLKILHDNYKIKRIIYSTYQAVSGAGIRGIEDLENKKNWKKPKNFLYPIHNNCLPQIDTFMENDYTKEEMKMIEETKKILDDTTLNITATAVRVPVKNCHCESINIEFENEFNLDELKQLLNKKNGIVVLDDINKEIYPIPTFVDGKDEVFIGRIRRDYSIKNGLNMWVVADNIRKGAATNAVEILEELLNNRKRSIKLRFF